jgi:nicotinate-nucleotide adenylyltransferase
MAGQRVGIFGGTFNPVHIGHLRAAIEVAEAVGLQAVEFVPAARPPHKVGNGLLDFDLRLELCRLAVEGLPGFSVNPLEARRDGPSYTCDTLTALGRSRPEDEFTFILGMGDLLCLGQRKNGYDLGRLAKLAVHARAGLDLDVFTDLPGQAGRGHGSQPDRGPQAVAGGRGALDSVRARGPARHLFFGHPGALAGRPPDRPPRAPTRFGPAHGPYGRTRGRLGRTDAAGPLFTNAQKSVKERGSPLDRGQPRGASSRPWNTL